MNAWRKKERLKLTLMAKFSNLTTRSGPRSRPNLIILARFSSYAVLIQWDKIGSSLTKKNCSHSKPYRDSETDGNNPKETI